MPTIQVEKLATVPASDVYSGGGHGFEIELRIYLQQMLLLAFLGATIADHSGYYLGRWIGPGFHHTEFVIKRKGIFDKTEAMLVRHGEMAIIIGRLITAIRSVVPLLTGISGLSPARYTLYDLIACAIWTSGLGLLVIGLDELVD